MPRLVQRPCSAQRLSLAVAAVLAVGCGGYTEPDQPDVERPAAPPSVRAAPPESDTSSPASVGVPVAAQAYGKSDAERMEDVRQIALAIEKYRRRTGRLPFDETFASAPDGGAGLSINVNLSGQPLPEEFRAPPPGVSGSVLTTEEFIEYMRKVMGAGFTLPTDPAPVPRFYQVHFAEGEYFVSAALFEPNEHTLPIADDWHKYQIGSRPDPAMKIRGVGEVEQR